MHSPDKPAAESGEKPFVAHYGLPTAKSGDIVRVEISADANILLVDEEALGKYRHHQPFHYVGGGYAAGAHNIGVPHDGHWHLVIDLGGRPGDLQHTAQVLHRDHPAHPGHAHEHGHTR